MRVRPTSIDSVTGTSRITSRLTSRAAASVPPSCRSLNSALGACSFALLIRGTSVAWVSELTGQHHNVGVFQFAACDAVFDLHGLLAVRYAELAAKYRDVFRQHRGAP